MFCCKEIGTIEAWVVRHCSYVSAYIYLFVKNLVQQFMLNNEVLEGNGRNNRLIFQHIEGFQSSVTNCRTRVFFRKFERLQCGEKFVSLPLFSFSILSFIVTYSCCGGYRISHASFT